MHLSCCTRRYNGVAHSVFKWCCLVNFIDILSARKYRDIVLVIGTRFKTKLESIVGATMNSCFNHKIGFKNNVLFKNALKPF